MAKNAGNDLITDQEIAFARLVLSGKMSDRNAAQAAGLNPDTADYIKSKPCVRAYMLEHRAEVQQQFAAQETEVQRRAQLRERILDRLWEIANTSPDRTRGSITSQVNALSMIAAVQGLVPKRLAGSSSPQRASSPQVQSNPQPGQPQISDSGSPARQQEKTVDPEPSPAELRQWLESLKDEDLGRYKM